MKAELVAPQNHKVIVRRPMLVLIPLKETDNDQIVSKFDNVCMIAVTIVCTQNQEEKDSSPEEDRWRRLADWMKSCLSSHPVTCEVWSKTHQNKMHVKIIYLPFCWQMRLGGINKQSVNKSLTPWITHPPFFEIWFSRSLLLIWQPKFSIFLSCLFYCFFAGNCGHIRLTLNHPIQHEIY